MSYTHLSELVLVTQQLTQRLLCVGQQGQQARVAPAVQQQGDQPHRARAPHLRVRGEGQAGVGRAAAGGLQNNGC